jgi:phospholipid/cholesterol/gamma-HCH transport system permease protein
MLHRVINSLVDISMRTGRAGLFLINASWKVLTPPYKLFPILKQLYFIGARSLLVITISGIFVGMVVAL